jgi:transport family protein 27
MVVLRCKVAIVGEATVGKSAYTQMVHSGGVTFPKNYLMTMGADLCIKEIRLDQQTSVEMCLIDVGGQDFYKKGVESYLDGIAAFIVVYDVAHKTTFEAVGRWVEMLRAKNKELPGFLLANKMDLRDKAEVSDTQAEILARNCRLNLFQASALRGVGLMEPLEAIARMFSQMYEDRARQCQMLK